MKVLLIRPGEVPEVGELNGYDEMRDYIGGCFETVNAFGYKIVFNDEFLYNNSPYNVTIGDVQYFGNIFVCKIGRINGELDFVGLDDADIGSPEFAVHFLMCKGYLII